MTSYLERKRSNFLSKDINLKNCLLEIPIPVAVNLKKTSTAEDSKQNVQGIMLYIYMGTPYIKIGLNSFCSVQIYYFVIIAYGMQKKRRMTLGNLYDPIGVKPSAVDVYARLILPLMFVLFQVVYWITCMILKSPMPEGALMIDHGKNITKIS